MKKSVFLLLILFFATFVVIADDNNFQRALSNCSYYYDSGVVNTDGMNIPSQKQISGWDGDKCVYKETVSYSGTMATVTCKLNKAQINELVSVMNAYSLIQQYSDKSLDISSISAVKDNPVVKVWSKYLQDPSTCNISGL